MYIYIYIYIYIHLYVYIYIHMYTHIYIYICVYMYIHTHIYIHTLFTFLYLYIYMYLIYIYIYIIYNNNIYICYIKNMHYINQTCPISCQASASGSVVGRARTAACWAAWPSCWACRCSLRRWSRGFAGGGRRSKGVIIVWHKPPMTWENWEHMGTYTINGGIIPLFIVVNVGKTMP